MVWQWDLHAEKHVFLLRGGLPRTLLPPYKQFCLRCNLHSLKAFEACLEASLTTCFEACLGACSLLLCFLSSCCSVPGLRGYVLSMTRASKQVLKVSNRWSKAGGRLQGRLDASLQTWSISRVRGEAEALEIVAKQICVNNIKMKQASRQASRSPALWKVRNKESKQTSALEIAKQLRQDHLHRASTSVEA